MSAAFNHKSPLTFCLYQRHLKVPVNWHRNRENQWRFELQQLISGNSKELESQSRERRKPSPHFSAKALYSATEDDDTEQFDRTEKRTGIGTGTGVRAATDEGLCERGRGMIEG
uniref:Uncharacterized protein n=1 Tax=Opuntia streptacantha TaxID=393608 RepID=A0A7C9F7U3_OPUST